MTQQNKIALCLCLLMGLPLFATIANADEPALYGDPMPAMPVVSLSKAVARLEAGESVSDLRIAGQITEVCQKKGCWMVLIDDDVTARVRFKEYGFFVPAMSHGKPSEVYGNLTKKTLTQKQARHYEKDAGRSGDVDKPVDEYAIMASSVTIAEN